MKPKAYLSEIHRLKRMTMRLERKIETLRHRAEGLKGITYDKEKVQTSPANAIEEAVVELVDLESRLAEVSHKYAEAAGALAVRIPRRSKLRRWPSGRQRHQNGIRTGQ